MPQPHQLGCPVIEYDKEDCLISSHNSNKGLSSCSDSPLTYEPYMYFLRQPDVTTLR